MINNDAWNEWAEYRKELKKPYKTKSAVTKNQNLLSKYSPSDQQWIVDYCIGQEWTAIWVDSALKAKPKQGFIEKHKDRGWAAEIEGNVTFINQG